VVLFTDRHATAREDEVVTGRRFHQRAHGHVALVGHDAEIGDFASQPFEQRAQEETVGVVDRAGPHALGRHLAGHHELVARGEQRDARAARHFELRGADAGRQPQRCRREALATREHERAACHVFAAAANPVTEPRRGLESHHVLAGRFGVFLHHDRIRACRHRRAGEDARDRSALQRLGCGTGRHALAHAQHRAWGNLRAAHGIAVHRTVVVRRYLQLRNEVLHEYAAGGVEGGHRLAPGERPGMAHQVGEGVVEGPQRGARDVHE
jgi:hypothetical protein